jgi:hypothetical protein
LINNNGHKIQYYIDNFEELDLLQAEIKGKRKFKIGMHLKRAKI